MSQILSIGGKIAEIIKKVSEAEWEPEVFVPENKDFGHYSTNVALRLAKLRELNPLDLAKELAEKISRAAPAGFFEEVHAAPPGFVNFWMSKEALCDEFARVSGDRGYGFGEGMKGKTVMVEFTDPNPFKLFHIGHLMSNAIGESIARLYEAAGAKVIRANYQADVGLHVAMSIWGMQHAGDEAPPEDAQLAEKVRYLGKAYAAGSRACRANENSPARAEIETLNKAIYEKSDSRVNALYEKGLKWSLDYFEEIYRRLGTKFDHYFFESDAGKEGLELVLDHNDVFSKSDGAIVFRGEDYGLHTRVFVNTQGLPTYEAKELGLNKKKFKLYPLDLSVIVTGNEINAYFAVLLKAMELVIPDVAEKTRHVPHGMMRLASGKMSSRTGEVIDAESLIDEIKKRVLEKERERDISGSDEETIREDVAIGAIKYSILRQGMGQDIVFDFDKSLSLKGDSGPYLQYAYARLRSILRKSGAQVSSIKCQVSGLNQEAELTLIRKIIEFPDEVSRAAEDLQTSGLANYLHKLAALANKFYETTPVLKEENESRRDALLALLDVASSVLKSGLGFLGIKAPEEI